MGRGTENGKGNLPMPSSVSGFCQKREREKEREIFSPRAEEEWSFEATRTHISIAPKEA